MNPKVLVLLSSYNGEEFLKQQLDSILNQKNVDINIIVRDDGSSDGTCSILQQYSECFPNQIKFNLGKNLGWKKSFMELLYSVSDSYDYYAFADQDDVWLPEKISSAIHFFQNNEVPGLYYSMMTQTDGDLRILNKQQNLHYPIQKPTVLFQNFVQGSTIVFNRSLLVLAQRYRIEDEIPHDIWLPILATYLGKIYFDENSYILYRKHENAVTVQMNKSYFRKLLKRIKNREIVENYAKYLIDGYESLLDDNDIIILKKVKTYNVNLGNKFFLLFNKSIRKNSMKGTILLKLAFLFNRIAK